MAGDCSLISSTIRPFLVAITRLVTQLSTILLYADRPYAATMESAVLEDDYPATRQRAIQDANLMQDIAVKQCSEAGIDTPPYKLTELIGKGSFGRVYKATSIALQKTVAVKIMSIEEGDSLAPGRNDTFAEILKEVTTLRILNDGGAKNVNRFIDCILVGHSMWVVTEYCAGGSVATLMRPTGFLPEMWIIPILREVSEALYWVHKHGIIHRDLKCANVLITEDGGVQLCDFGVAGIIKSKVDKRSTITGTLQWMAPELFDNNVTYGNEVDIWAFGSMAYEAATGFPPNATTILDMDLNRFGAYLKESCPRLEGDEYSDQLKDLISYCMVADPAKRPRIEELQRHPYIRDSHADFPTSSLKDLLEAYKDWEKRGGNRQSLFNQGGAQCHSRNNSMSVEDQGWDYGTMDHADQVSSEDDQAEDSLSLPKARPLLPPLLTRGQRHRRRLPADLKAVKPPLAKAFDPNTMVNYQDHVKAFYQQSSPTGEPEPLSAQMLFSPASSGDTSNDATIRESPIGAACPPAKTQRVSPITPDDDLTIKPPRNQSISVDPGPPPQLQLQFDTCRTQDWTFPVMLPDSSSHPNSQHGGTDSTVSSWNLPSRSHSSSRTFSIGGMDVAVSPITPIDDSPWSRRPHRADGLSISSRISLIDLDASLVSLTPSDARLRSTYNESSLHTNKSNHTESFPQLSSPPTNGTSLAPVPDSSSPTSGRLHYAYTGFSSSPPTLRSPMSPGHHDYTSKYSLYQAVDLEPSALLSFSSNPNDGLSQLRSTYGHHQYNDSGYLPSSSSFSGSTSKAQTRDNSFTPSSGERPTIDEPPYETPPRYRDDCAGQHYGGHEAAWSQREPSMYLPCEEGEPDEDKVQYGSYDLAAETTDASHRKLFLPHMILESRTSAEDSNHQPASLSSKRTGSVLVGDNGGDHPPTNGSMARDIRRPRDMETEIGKETEISDGANLSRSRRFVPSPPLPAPPRPDVISGMASKEAMKEELTRLLGSMVSHLQHTANVIQLPVLGPPLMPSVVKNNGVKPTDSNTGVAKGGKKAGRKGSSA
ncbi:Serine/threonine-protein kinase 25 [Rhypophila sp. PSN 637]